MIDLIRPISSCSSLHSQLLVTSRAPYDVGVRLVFSCFIPDATTFRSRAAPRRPHQYRALSNVELYDVCDVRRPFRCGPLFFFPAFSSSDLLWLWFQEA